MTNFNILKLKEIPIQIIFFDINYSIIKSIFHVNVSVNVYGKIFNKNHE